jgi:hypothetical protein
MAKYALIYHGGGMAETEEDQAAVMAAWGAWIEGLGTALVDGGAPLGESVTVTGDGSTSLGGGANPATGYSFVLADSVDAAAKLTSGCPIFDSGGTIEVAETIDM